MMTDLSRPLDDQVPDGKRLEAAARIAWCLNSDSPAITRKRACDFPHAAIDLLKEAARQIARLKESGDE